MKYSTYIKPRKRTVVKVSRSFPFYLKRIRKVFFSLIPLFVVASGVYGGYLVVFNSTVFTLSTSKVEIYGTGYFIDSRVFKEAVYSHIVGKNIVKLNTLELEKELVQEFPSIKGIVIKKKIPPYLIVTVTERVPKFAVYKGDVASALMVDSEGFVLGPLDERFKNLFKVQYAEEVSASSFINPAILSLYQDILSGADRSGLVLDKIILDVEITHVYLSGGVEVLLSNKKGVYDSFSAVSSILKKFTTEEKKVTKIDLRYDKVIVSYD